MGATMKLQRFYHNYFSGEDCKIYFSTDRSGMSVPGFSFIEYSLNSNKVPLYGYNDKYFKAVASGNYLVQGRMGFNLTSRDRLDAIFAAVDSSNSGSADDRTITVETSVSLVDLLNDDDSVLVSALVNYLKDTYWGVDGGSRKRRFDQVDWLPNGDISDRGFDILLLFGNPHGSPKDMYVKLLTSVHVLGESMMVGSDGRNTIIMYDFIARSVDDAPSWYNWDADTQVHGGSAAQSAAQQPAAQASIQDTAQPAAQPSAQPSARSADKAARQVQSQAKTPMVKVDETRSSVAVRVGVPRNVGYTTEGAYWRVIVPIESYSLSQPVSVSINGSSSCLILNNYIFYDKRGFPKQIALAVPHSYSEIKLSRCFTMAVRHKTRPITYNVSIVNDYTMHRPPK